MTPLTLRHDKTTVTLTDGQTAWTFDRDNAQRLIAQLSAHVAELEGETVERARFVPAFTSRRGKVVAP